MNKGREKSELCERQLHLLGKLHTNTATDEEQNELVISLRGIVVKLAKKFAPSFPNYSREEIISEGMNALWTSCLKFDISRKAVPSTFVYSVTQNAYLKWWHRERNCHPKVLTDELDENGRRKKRPLPSVSLDQYLDEHGDIHEIAGDNNRVDTSKFAFHERVYRLYDVFCRDVVTYDVLNRLFNIKTLQGLRGRRTKQTLKNVAADARAPLSLVQDLATEVGSRLDDEDLWMIRRYEFQPPAFTEYFNVDVVNDLSTGDFDIVDLHRQLGNFT